MKLHSRVLLGAAILSVALTASAQEHLQSLNKAYIDPSISPKTDFYHHVNHGWQEANPLTPEHARYGQFNILNDSSNNRVQRIVTGLAATNPERGTVAQKVSTIYEQGMDSVRRNALGAQPIQPIINKIQNTKPEGMEDLFLLISREYGSPFVNAGPQENLVNSQEYAMYISGAPIGLGDRDYYLKTDKRNKDVLAAYKKMIVAQMRNAGFSKKEANRIMKNVIKYETLIADSTWTREESRNIAAMYNPRSLAQVKELYPNIDWDKFFPATMKIDTPSDFIVTELKTVAQGDKLFKSMTDREKKDLYLWYVVRGAAPYLSDDFADASFEFNKIMSGVSQQRPRWKRALAATEGVLGEGIGELYVAQYFPESSKQYMLELVGNLQTALGKHIMHLPWMSDDTKLQALRKLNAFTVKIGYPDKWKDYSGLDIDPEASYYDNMHKASLWAQDEYLKKWGKPVDKTEWGMTPQTINAYYNPTANEIVFPAGILQAPFFDPNASDAENYGGIGVVIGHEMTHGFDDQGSQFDAKGNMVNWWKPEDAAAFKEMTQGLIGQFDEVEVLPGLHANGAYTLGENIADQGGLNVAMTAFLDSQKKKGVDVDSPEALIDGFTPAQVFYMNYANLWAQNIRDAEIRSLTTGDVHALGENRVNVSLRNLQDFFNAFDIREGDKMFRPENERIIIW